MWYIKYNIIFYFILSELIKEKESEMKQNMEF